MAVKFWRSEPGGLPSVRMALEKWKSGISIPFSSSLGLSSLWCGVSLLQSPVAFEVISVHGQFITVQDLGLM